MASTPVVGLIPPGPADGMSDSSTVSKRPRAPEEFQLAAVPWLASQLSQDLVDSIVECVADGRDPYALLRLRAVSDVWARAAKNALEVPTFAKAAVRVFSWHLSSCLMARMKLVLRRDCTEICVCLKSHTDRSVFERALQRAHSDGVDAVRRDQQPRALTLQPWSHLQHLNLSGSTAEGVNNDTMRCLADALPTLRSLNISGCTGVSDVNAFEARALTDLNISYGCAVDTNGMCRLLYLRRLTFNANDRMVMINPFVSARLTELTIALCDEVTSEMRWFSQSDLPGVKQAKFTNARDSRMCARWLSCMPALTALEIQYFDLDARTGHRDTPIHLDFGFRRRFPVQSLVLRECEASVDLRPFSKTLTELDLSWDPCPHTDPCPLRNELLEDLCVLATLRMSHIRNITSLAPVADTLTELDARGDCCGVTNETLADMQCLRVLNISDNQRVTTIVPLIKTLTHLRGAQNIPQSDIEQARQHHLVEVEQ